MRRKDEPITYFMDNVTIINELLAEVEGLQRQLDVMGQKLEVMKQRLALAEISMQADAAALQASELRVKQLEIIVASQKSQVDESPNREIVESSNRETVESLNCGIEEAPNRLDDSIKKSVAELVEASKSDYSHSFINSSTNQRFNDSSTKTPDSPISQFTDSSTKNTDSSTSSRDARIVTDLKKAIGLNDRFRFRNDLFNKDEKLMLDTIEALNGLANMSDAKAYLSARFAWKEDDASVVYFYEILERKFV